MVRYLLFIACLVPSLVFSAELDCDEPFSTQDMNECLQLDIAEAKSNLDLYVNEIRDNFLNGDEDRQAFEKAQSEWVVFVEADCNAAYTHYIDGSIRGVILGSCQLDHHSLRTKRLWATYLENTTTSLPDPNMEEAQESSADESK